MFANRYTAFIDACTLASALKRNLLLSLAEAEFFRVRWSAAVISETEAAITAILAGKGVADATARAARARAAMTAAFEEAEVLDYAAFLPACAGLPDGKDAHVLAAALKTRASTIVTENLKDFPGQVLAPLNIEARTADAFVADTIALNPGQAVAAIGKVRARFRRPDKSADELLLDMEAAGLIETVDALRPHLLSL